MTSTETVPDMTADELAELFDASGDDDVDHLVSDREHHLSVLMRRAPVALCGQKLDGGQAAKDEDGTAAVCPECRAEARRRGWTTWS